MNLPILLYTIDFINNLDQFCSFITLFFFLFYIVTLFWWLFTNDGYHEESNEQCITILKKSSSYIWIAIVAIFINLLLPSQKTMYMMLGTSYLQNSTIPSKVAEVIEYKLGSILNELKEKDKK